MRLLGFEVIRLLGEVIRLLGEVIRLLGFKVIRLFL